MSRSTTRDEGVTLSELVIVMALVGVLATVLVGVVAVTLRTVPQVDARTDEARTLQGVVTWLPQDVDSTPPTGFNATPSAASGCTLSPGTNLLRMEWTENVSSPVRFIANYRSVPLGSGLMRIERVTCFGSGAGPLGNSISKPVSADLPALPPGWTTGQMPVRVTIDATAGLVELVTFEVRTLQGKVVRTDSAPKNPAQTLPPTTLEVAPSSIATTTSTVAPTTTTDPSATTTTDVGGPTTTLVTTTTLPPCAVTGATISPASIDNVDPNGNGNKGIDGVGVLKDEVLVTVQTNGFCSGIEGRADTGAPNGELFRNGSRSGSTFFVRYPGRKQGSSELWADGTRPIRIFSTNGTTVLWTVNLQVT